MSKFFLYIVAILLGLICGLFLNVFLNVYVTSPYMLLIDSVDIGMCVGTSVCILGALFDTTEKIL